MQYKTVGGVKVPSIKIFKICFITVIIALLLFNLFVMFAEVLIPAFKNICRMFF